MQNMLILFQLLRKLGGTNLRKHNIHRIPVFLRVSPAGWDNYFQLRQHYQDHEAGMMHRNIASF